MNHSCIRFSTFISYSFCIVVGTVSFGELKGTGFQGVADPSTAYQRDELVNSVLSKLSESRFVIVQSPPASGKSTLLQLIWHRCIKINVKYIRLRSDQNPYETLGFAGIDLTANKLDPVKFQGDVIILIDDAQNAFSNLSFFFGQI
jgi:energy-coupling factor transporter ATP-binding protein EcfA2